MTPGGPDGQTAKGGKILETSSDRFRSRLGLPNEPGLA